MRINSPWIFAWDANDTMATDEEDWWIWGTSADASFVTWVSRGSEVMAFDRNHYKIGLNVTLAQIMTLNWPR